MATASSFLTSAVLPRRRGHGVPTLPLHRRRSYFAVSAQAEQQQELEQSSSEVQTPQIEQEEESKQEEEVRNLQEELQQPMAKSKNMTVEYGGQWLSSVTRHVRIYAAYIDPVSRVFDQTQMDKLTLLLDPTNEFIWAPDSCQKVYAYFQELVDHYEGADLTEYTLRLIGSDIEHYIRKLLYDGEIKYNMDARVLNFSMGKPRVIFKSNQIENED